MDKIGETILEINLSALEHNFNYFKSKLHPSTKFLAVVKAFAYGSDMAAITQKLESLNVDYFAVAYVKEGVLPLFGTQPVRSKNAETVFTGRQRKKAARLSGSY